MKELIKITEKDGMQAVSARDLHGFLESKQDFSNWIANRIKKYGLVENQDFEILHNNFIEQTTRGGHNKIEYALSIDCAKELAMVEGNAKGKQARQYFIACEKKLKQKPLSQLEIIAQSAQILLDQDKRISKVEDKLLQIETRTTTTPDYFTVVGYGTLQGLSLNLRQAASIGKRASTLCKYRGIELSTIPDPRFGVVKLYPTEILKEVFSKPIN